MHELSICHALVSQIKSVVATHHANKVVSVVLGVGPLAGVDAELLKTAYPHASAGTVAEHAALIIEALPLRVRCNMCNKESNALPNKLVCQHCGAWQTTLISGDELLLMSVELEKPEDSPAVTQH